MTTHAIHASGESPRPHERGIGAPSAVELVLGHLDLELRRVGAAVRARLGEAVPDAAELDATRRRLEDAAERAGVQLPLRLLRDRFRLGRFERDAFALVAAAELDPTVADGLARLRRYAGPAYVDGQLCMDLFAGGGPDRLAKARALEVDAPLFEAGLLDATPLHGQPPHRSAACLTLPGHVREFLRGGRRLSDELTPCARRLVATARREDCVGSAELVDQLTEAFRGHYARSVRGDRVADAARLDFGRGLLVGVAGTWGSGRRLAVKAAAAACERPVIELDAALLAELDGWARALERAFQEASLYGEILHVHGVDGLAAEASRAAWLVRLVRHYAVPVVLSHEDGLPQPVASEVALQLRTPLKLTASEIAAAWRAHVPERGALDAGVDPDALAERAALSGKEIQRGMRLAQAWASIARDGGPARLSQETLARAAAMQRRSDPGGLTEQDGTAPTLTFADLVLAPKTYDDVERILGAAKHRRTVMRDWGFERLLGRGGGVICLFDGPPGTGKTLTAELLARALDLELHRINVAKVVDKYIGETDKNLTRLFARIIPERTLLLFDEADSLFASRVQVTTSTDRYANNAVNTLLQLIERYTGVVVLTTNLKDRIDSAFERRILYKVRFDKPDEQMRRSLWEVHLPPSAPVAGDVDLAELARTFEFSGGQIKNVCLRAALRGAEAGTITHDVLATEAGLEAAAGGMLVKLGRGA